MFNLPAPQNTPVFVALKAEMAISGTYDDIYIKPYTINYNRDIHNVLVETTEGGSNLNPLAFAQVAPHIIQQSTDANNIAPIARGFAERRFRFVIQMQPFSNAGLSVGVRHVLTGYTDGVEITNINGRQHINPEMKMYLNSAYVIRDEPTANGAGMVSTITDSYQFLQDPGSATDYMRSLGLYAIRPEDIFTTLQEDSNPINQTTRSMGYALTDTRNMISGRMLRNSRGMNNSSNYLAKIVQGYAKAELGSDEDIADAGDSPDDIFGNARENVRERALSSSPVMRTFINDYAIQRQGYITYGDMCNAIGGLDDDRIMNVIPPTTNTLAKMYTRGQREGWAGSTDEQIAAQMALRALPPIMLRYALGRLQFSANNVQDPTQAQMSGAFVFGTDARAHCITPLGCEGFCSNVNMINYIRAAAEAIVVDILNPISRNNERNYQMVVSVNMLGDIELEVAIGNSTVLVPFTAPVFCDGLFAPVVSDDSNGVRNMATQVGAMLKGLSNSFNHNQMQRQIITSPHAPLVNSQQPSYNPAAMTVDTSNLRW